MNQVKTTVMVSKIGQININHLASKIHVVFVAVRQWQIALCKYCGNWYMEDAQRLKG